MLQPVTIRCWAVFVLRNPSDLQHSGPGSLDAFLRCVVQGFTAMGMKMPAQPDLVDKVGDMGRYPEQGRLDQAVTNAMKKLQAKNKRLDVAFFIIPRKGAHLPRIPPPASSACPPACSSAAGASASPAEHFHPLPRHVRMPAQILHRHPPPCSHPVRALSPATAPSHSYV